MIGIRFSRAFPKFESYGMLETAASVGWKVKDAIVGFHGIGRLVGHQTSQLCPSYPGCIINMSGYDFRKGQGIILCSLGAEIAAAAHFPLFLFWPIGTLSWLRTGGSRRRGTTTMDLGP